MTPIEKAARAIYQSHPWGDEDAGTNTWEHLSADWKNVYVAGAIAVIRAIREPDEGMSSALNVLLSDWVQEVGTNEDVFRGVIDSILSEEEAKP